MINPLLLRMLQAGQDDGYLPDGPPDAPEPVYPELQPNPSLGGADRLALSLQDFPDLSHIPYAGKGQSFLGGLMSGAASGFSTGGVANIQQKRADVEKENSKRIKTAEQNNLHATASWTARLANYYKTKQDDRGRIIVTEQMAKDQPGLRSFVGKPVDSEALMSAVNRPPEEPMVTLRDPNEAAYMGQKVGAKVRQGAYLTTKAGLRAERAADRAIAAMDTAPTLTPDGMKAAAKMYAMTGQLPPMGMGGKGMKVRTDIISLAAQLYPDLDVAGNAAIYRANQGSLAASQKMVDAVGAFERTALKNMDVLLEQMKRIPDTGSPLFNKPLRLMSKTGLGSAELAAFETAKQVVAPEFAKILNNPSMGGVLSDDSRREMEKIVRGDATLAQMSAIARVLKTDASNRRTAYQVQIDDIKARLRSGSLDTGGAPVDTWERGPDGMPRRVMR